MEKYIFQINIENIPQPTLNYLTKLHKLSARLLQKKWTNVPTNHWLKVKPFVNKALQRSFMKLLSNFYSYIGIKVLLVCCSTTFEWTFSIKFPSNIWTRKTAEKLSNGLHLDSLQSRLIHHTLKHLEHYT